jgi:hypothetical protein
MGFDMDMPASLRITRRQAAIGFGLMVAGFLLAACAPQSPPAPGSWAEEYARRKEKYREWGQGTGKK